MELTKPLNSVNRFTYGADNTVIGNNVPSGIGIGISKSGEQSGLLVHTIGKEYIIWFYDSVKEQWEDYGQSEVDQRSLTLPWSGDYDKIFFQALNPTTDQELRLIGLSGNIVIDADPSDGLNNEDSLFQNGNAQNFPSSILGGANVSGPSGPTGPAGDDAFTTFIEDGNGNLIPTTDAQYSIGQANARLADIFTANITTGDLVLNNTTLNPNTIDGTTGSWRIQEGESDLYIINEITGKKFKFNLISID